MHLFGTIDDWILKLWSLTILIFDSQIAPDWRQARTLKKSLEDRITKGINISLLIFPHPILNIICSKLNIFIHHHSWLGLNVDGVIGIGIAATAVGLIAGGIAAAVSTSRKRWINYLLCTYEITVWSNHVSKLLYLKNFCIMLFSYY